MIDRAVIDFISLTSRQPDNFQQILPVRWWGESGNLFEAIRICATLAFSVHAEVKRDFSWMRVNNGHQRNHTPCHCRHWMNPNSAESFIAYTQSCIVAKSAGGRTEWRGYKKLIGPLKRLWNSDLLVHRALPTWRALNAPFMCFIK